MMCMTYLVQGFFSDRNTHLKGIGLLLLIDRSTLIGVIGTSNCELPQLDRIVQTGFCCLQTIVLTTKPVIDFLIIVYVFQYSTFDKKRR